MVITTSFDTSIRLVTERMRTAQWFQKNPTNIRDRNKKKIIKNYESIIGKTTTQNYRKQIHNFEEEYNSCPRKATEIVIFKELLWEQLLSEWACRDVRAELRV